MNLLKLQDTKLIHRNQLHFYILTMKDQKEKLVKQSDSPPHQNRIKYLRINYLKRQNGCTLKTLKLLRKEIKDDTNRWKDIPCSWIGRINIV